MQQYTEADLYRMAEMKVLRRGFLIHFVPYVIINFTLVIIWRVTGGGFPWFLFPLCLWGFLVLLHYIAVFVFKERRRMGKRTKMMIEMEVQKMKAALTPVELPNNRKPSD